VLKGIFGPKREDMTGGWSKVQNAELHTLYSSPNATKMDEDNKTVGQVTGMDDRRKTKPGEKGPLGRPWCRWQDSIKIILEEHSGKT
jgi:hypothetical protein